MVLLNDPGLGQWLHNVLHCQAAIYPNSFLPLVTTSLVLIAPSLKNGYSYHAYSLHPTHAVGRDHPHHRFSTLTMSITFLLSLPSGVSLCPAGE